MNQDKNPRPCPPELLQFCRTELEALSLQIDQSLEHLSQGETLAALGAWSGVEPRLEFAGTTLQLLARLYPFYSKPK